jgi:hypothetical protein
MIILKNRGQLEEIFLQQIIFTIAKAPKKSFVFAPAHVVTIFFCFEFTHIIAGRYNRELHKPNLSLSLTV